MFGLSTELKHKGNLATINRFEKEREDVREFVNHLDLVTRLEPRDAFFGRRTNTVQLYRLA